MPEFILDKNVDLKSDQAEYPDYFFKDLFQKRGFKLVRGGSGYDKEISEKTSLLNLFNELSSANKVRRIPNEEVDQAQETLEAAIAKRFTSCPTCCDDPHIFALAKVSRCFNVITKETRMATCRDTIRGAVGHDLCPPLKIIRTENAYKDVV